MPAPRLLPPLSLACAAALSACASGGPEGGGALRIETAKEIVRAEEPIVEARGDSARVVVHGSPLDGASQEAVASALILPQKVGGATFRAVGADYRGPRLALSFTGMSDAELCGETQLSPPPANPPKVSAAWCLDDRMIGAASAGGGALRGPSDPGFARAMRSVLNSFLAPNRKGGGVT